MPIHMHRWSSLHPNSDPMPAPPLKVDHEFLVMCADVTTEWVGSADLFSQTSNSHCGAGGHETTWLSAYNPPVPELGRTYVLHRMTGALYVCAPDGTGGLQVCVTCRHGP
uniref:Uncharacterized protein n=1 Tax=Eutreptiella gymnastica TaxID=73025 RepID=A0A7S4LK40_9EUGL